MKPLEELMKLSARDQIIETHNVILPISGGRGNSKEDAITFDKISYDRGIDLEYQILHYLLDILKIHWRTGKSALMQVEEKKYEKIEVIFGDEEDQFWEYYFDITNFIYPS